MFVETKGSKIEYFQDLGVSKRRVKMSANLSGVISFDLLILLLLFLLHFDLHFLA